MGQGKANRDGSQVLVTNEYLEYLSSDNAQKHMGLEYLRISDKILSQFVTNLHFKEGEPSLTSI